MAKRKSAKRAGSIVFLGTGRFAAAALDALEEAGHTPALVVSRRARSEETGRRTRRGPVSKWALDHEVPLVRPKSRSDHDWLAQVADLEPEIAIVADHGGPLPESFPELPQKGTIGLHASLLPAYRGADPIRTAIWHGDKQTGVTAYRVTDDGEWKGPILAQDEVPIAPEETFGELLPRVSEAGGALLVRTVERVLKAKKMPRGDKQKEKKASEAVQFTERHRKPPWWLTSQQIHNRLRAFAPDRGLMSFIRARRVEILRGRPIEWLKPTSASTGTYLGVRFGRVAVLCDEGTVFGIESLRDEGGETTQAADYMRAAGIDSGSKFI